MAKKFAVGGRPRKGARMTDAEQREKIDVEFMTLGVPSMSFHLAQIAPERLVSESE